jgi:hypothetical protein
MTGAAIDCLNQDDLRMFCRGACHVFAVALQRYKPQEQYKLRRVVFRGYSAYHVYARSGDWLVDVGGVRREADYFKWLKRRAIENEWDPAIRSEEVSETELLRQATIDTRLGVVSPLRVPEKRLAFISTHNVTLSVVAMSVSNPDCSPVEINR